MGLKKRLQVSDSFSMASMTDVIFLLLIFFLVSSTIIVPNVIKVSLPQATQQPASDMPTAQIALTAQHQLFLSLDKTDPVEISIEALAPKLIQFSATHPDSYVAIHADESVPYSEVVAVINRATEAKMRIVLATRLNEK